MAGCIVPLDVRSRLGGGDVRRANGPLSVVPLPRQEGAVEVLGGLPPHELRGGENARGREPQARARPDVEPGLPRAGFAARPTGSGQGQNDDARPETATHRRLLEKIARPGSPPEMRASSGPPATDR